MNVLAVIANPRQSSYTRRLLQSFLTSYQKYHSLDTITELDLYRAAIPLVDDAVLQAWTKPRQDCSREENRLLTRIDYFTDQFISADKIIFAAPMWNLHFPPLLDAYMSNIMVAGKTFAYTENGCQGLVQDKPVLLLHVRGGLFSSGPMQAFDYAVPYLRALCNMVGILNFQSIICEGIELCPEKAESILNQAMIQSAVLAEHF